MATARTRVPKERSERERIYRSWIEVIDRESGSIRKLPLKAMAKILLKSKTEKDPPPSRVDVLELTDGSERIEVKNIDELSVQLRQRYPDATYERSLHMERDHEAEERRADAISRMVQLIVDSFIKTLSAEDAAAYRLSLKTKEGKKALRELWPKLVDAFFYALCNPKR
jgi:hypothetical protein